MSIISELEIQHHCNRFIESIWLSTIILLLLLLFFVVILISFVLVLFSIHKCYAWAVCIHQRECWLMLPYQLCWFIQIHVGGLFVSENQKQHKIISLILTIQKPTKYWQKKRATNIEKKSNVQFKIKMLMLEILFYAIHTRMNVHERYSSHFVVPPLIHVHIHIYTRTACTHTHTAIHHQLWMMNDIRVKRMYVGAHVCVVFGSLPHSQRVRVWVIASVNVCVYIGWLLLPSYTSRYNKNTHNNLSAVPLEPVAACACIGIRVVVAATHTSHMQCILRQKKGIIL